MVGRNNPNYDFELGKLLIDVKATRASRVHGSKSASWRFRTTTAPNNEKTDVYVVFAFGENAKELILDKVEHLLLVPQFLYDGNTTATFTETSALLREYEVQPEELVEELQMMRKMKAEGML
jgi:hypothetical protein